MLITWVMDGVHLSTLAHVQMCPYFRISETAGRIVLEFDEWLENH